MRTYTLSHSKQRVYSHRKIVYYQHHLDGVNVTLIKDLVKVLNEELPVFLGIDVDFFGEEKSLAGK